jgi:CelD/BcsL family acetyltransferase involved in cellulose biosynthesis
MTETAAVTDVQIRVMDDLDVPGLDGPSWDALLATGPTDVVFLTHEWQRLWWQARGDERLAVVVAERDGRVLALAPLFAVEGSISLVGSGGSDFLDFIGGPDEALLAAMLDAARDAAPAFSAIELYHVPVDSPTTAQLPGIAARLGLELHREETSGAPYADLADAELVRRLTARRSVRKEEARMRRAGPLCVRQAAADELDLLVELFFEQHAARWRPAGEESFERRGSRELVHAVAIAGHRGGWARLTLLEWHGQPAAIDISLIHGSTQLSWLVSRDPAIREHSPGRVLRAHVVLEAARAGRRRFDFGLGEEDYKLRDSTGVTRLANWFLYA